MLEQSCLPWRPLPMFDIYQSGMPSVCTFVYSSLSLSVFLRIKSKAQNSFSFWASKTGTGIMCVWDIKRSFCFLLNTEASTSPPFPKLGAHIVLLGHFSMKSSHFTPDVSHAAIIQLRKGEKLLSRKKK